MCPALSRPLPVPLAARSLTVVLAANGYPGSYAKGSPIENLEAVTTAKVFHAGTALKDGRVVRGVWRRAAACELALVAGCRLQWHDPWTEVAEC